MKNLLKTEIEKTAKEENVSEIEIITAMQGHCAKMNDEKTLEILCELKMDYITI